MADEAPAKRKRAADAPPEYTFRLKRDWFDKDVEPTASFQAGWEAVELSGDATFKTEDPQIALGLRDLPFLESAD